MNIGIVTQPLYYNYGGILQNYALQQILISLGHNPVTLDYKLEVPRWYHYYSIAVRLIRRFQGIKIPIIPKRKNIKRDNPNIIHFLEENVSLTSPFYRHYPKSLIKKYSLNAIIVGSDQVWRPKYNGSIEDMFLKFTVGYSIKRIAYAASFGTSRWEFQDGKKTEICKKLLKRFNAISVRETSAIPLVSKLGMPAVKVLDPTMLLGMEGFESIIRPYEKKPTDKYIAAYVLDNSLPTITMIQDLGRKKGMSVIFFKENETDMGPGEWIDVIKSCECVVTDSFHGTVFSILCHKPFTTIINADRGAERFYDLLSPLHLDFALINEPNEIIEIDYERFNWEIVDNILSVERSKSYRFLKDNL